MTKQVMEAAGLRGYALRLLNSVYNASVYSVIAYSVLLVMLAVIGFAIVMNVISVPQYHSW